MRKTLLLVFIHGFKGGDDTFGTFPEHIRALISHALPKVDVVAITYPKFETRGELKDCVSRFREWLENKVIDLEVARGTPSPTIDPSVHVVLTGHSMGGIVAAETLLLLANDQPLPPASSFTNNGPTYVPSNTTLSSSTSTSHPTPLKEPDSSPSPSSFMFPRIQGLLAFDTPFLGISPGMISQGAEGHYKTAATAYSAFSEASSLLGWGQKPESTSNSPPPKVAGMLPAPPSGQGNVDAAAAPRWQSWGRYAMFAGAAGAVAAGGAAIYSQREKLSAGVQWATSHLEFVGDLAKPELLKQRVKNVGSVGKDRGIGATNFYTRFTTEKMDGGRTVKVERTFCSLPVGITRGDGEADGFKWYMATNEKAKSETGAHMSMFLPRENPGFYVLCQKAKEEVIGWVDTGWYEASEETEDAGKTHGEVGDDGWEKPDYDADEVKEKEREKEKGTGMGGDWEGLDAAEDLNAADADDVKMRDEILEAGAKIWADDGGGKREDLESSVIVDVDKGV